MYRSLSCALIVALALTGLASARQAPAAPDFSGVWTGTTTVPDVGEDALTLELKPAEKTYALALSDAAAVVVPGSATGVTVAGDTLSFDITVNTASGQIPVRVVLKIDGDKLAGSWVTQDGASAPITLARRK
jgi:hypothetical protein